MSLSPQQVQQLLQPIHPRRVLHAQGQSHVAGYDVIAHLTRIFGFGNWDKEILSLDLVGEHNSAPDPKDPSKGKWRITYRCVMRLTIRDPEGNVLCRIEDAATGTSPNLPQYGDAHDFAVKNAITYALKRCAKDFGDQFGLSLYNKGQTNALMGNTLVRPDVVVSEDVESHAPAPQSMGNDENHVEAGDDTPAPPTPPAPRTPIADLHAGMRPWDEVGKEIVDLLHGNKQLTADLWTELGLPREGLLTKEQIDSATARAFILAAQMDEA